MQEANEMEWLRQTLGGAATGEDEAYLARPSAAKPHLLVPLHSPAVASASLHRYSDDRSIKQRLVALAAQGVARAGLLERGPGERVELEPFAMISQLAKVLAVPDLIGAISIGPPRRNRKPVVQLLRPNGKTVGFAKVAWSPFTKELTANEGHWLKAVSGKLPSGFVAPEVLFEGPVLDSAGNETPNSVLVIGPLATGPLSRRREELTVSKLASFGRCLGTDNQAIKDLPHVQVSARSHLDKVVPVQAFLDRHGETMVETGMWHGDLTPWNTATSAAGMSIWDWEFAGGERPIGFDAMHVRFETIRRAESNNEVAAVNTIVTETPSIVAELNQPAEAMIDLYLLELLWRELRLAGEGWEPNSLGPLDKVVAAELNKRLS